MQDKEETNFEAGKCSMGLTCRRVPGLWGGGGPLSVLPRRTLRCYHLVAMRETAAEAWASEPPDLRVGCILLTPAWAVAVFSWVSPSVPLSSWKLAL